MAEVAHTRQNHRQPMFIRRFDDLCVANGPARLDDGSDSGLRSRIKTVPEREEGVRGHHAPFTGSCAFMAASFTLSTRLICPAPMPTV